MSQRENIFVFVVCGAREHIDTLHFSLRALARFSQTRIIVVTDSTRNEIPVQHDKVIDIATPPQYDHHQASIYLKTGLHKFLPTGNLYCYLDTDVVALDTQVDGIFSQYQSPITFAKDHCVMDRFSPSAVRCDCAREFTAWQKELKGLFARYYENPEKKNKLIARLDTMKNNKLGYAWISLRFRLSGNTFKLDSDTFYDKAKLFWHDKDGAPVLYDAPHAITSIEEASPYRCNREDTKDWTIGDKHVFDCRCGHLREQIQKTFGIEVKEHEWQHWNGGVFLFDDASYDFLNAWHEKTMLIFTLPEWKTRDQGTLIATVWQFGLERHPLLSSVFNLICDYENLHQNHLGGLRFDSTIDPAVIEPHFIHVYHHWADPGWDVWQAVEARTGIEADNTSKTINALWIGTELSKIELLTIKSFLDKGHTFKLWVYDKLTTPLPAGILIGDASAIIPRDQVFAYKNENKYGHGKGSVAGFSDIFRYKLLYEKGGWWVDMDVTCLKPFDFTAPYFFRSHHELSVVGNVMKCPKHSDLMKKCYDEAIASIDEHNTDWHKPIEILNKHVAALGLQTYIRNGLSNPDQWHITSRYIRHSDEPPTNWYFIHWQNEEWRSRHISKGDFYYKSRLAQLLQRYGLFDIPQAAMSRLSNAVKHFYYFQ